MREGSSHSLLIVFSASTPFFSARGTWKPTHPRFGRRGEAAEGTIDRGALAANAFSATSETGTKVGTPHRRCFSENMTHG